MTQCVLQARYLDTGKAWYPVDNEMEESMKAAVLFVLLCSLNALAGEKIVEGLGIKLQTPPEAVYLTLDIEHQAELDVDLATLSTEDPTKGILFAGAFKDKGYKGARLDMSGKQPTLDKNTLLALRFSAEQKTELFRRAEEIFTAMQSMAHIKMLYKEKHNFLGLLVMGKTIVLVTKVG